MELNDLTLREDANLQVYYRFQDNLNDASGNGRNGTFVAVSGSPVYVPARYGKGIDLELDNTQRVNTGWNPNVGTGNFSLSCVVKPETIAGLQYGLMSTYDADTNKGLFIQRNTLYGGIIFGCAGSGYDHLDGQTPLVAGKLMQILAVRESSWLRLYINGVEDPGSPVANTGQNVNSGYNLFVGLYYAHSIAGSTGCFDGVMDDAAFFDRALTKKEAQALYNTMSGILAAL